MEQEIKVRSAESGLPVAVLRAVYLREVSSSPLQGSALCDSAFRRVDGFICYALSRDVRYSADRDLAPSALTH